jgi:septum site-determining protein MinD
MGKLLSQIRKQFDYCLIDCPAGLEFGFQLAVAYADRAIIVATNDASSLRDAQRTAEALRQRDIDQIRMVVNRVRPKLLRRLNTTIDDAMDSAGLPLLGIVPEDEAVILATNRGEPLIYSHRRNAAQAYANIARRITGQSIPLMKVR